MKQFISLDVKDTPSGFTPEMFEGEPLVKLTENEGSITLHYTFPGFYKTPRSANADGNTIDFSAIKIQSAGYLSESGKPLLPSFGRYLNIPAHSSYSFLTKTAGPIEITDILVAPSQANVTDDNRKHDFEYDKQFYDTDDYFPKEIVEVTGPFDIDDYTALLVHVRPLQYNPAQKKLLCHNEVELTFTFTPIEDAGSTRFLNEGETDQQVFGNLFLNPKKDIEKRLNISQLTPNVMIPATEIPKMLVIYPESFKVAADRYCEWKIKKGLKPEMVTIESIGNNVKAIKDYIRGKKQKQPTLRYVTILGDVPLIESETIQSSAFGPNITDYYYSTPTDPAPGTNPLVFPWLSVGRIPVSSKETALKAIDKIIRYEKNPPTDPDYYKRITTVAFFQDNHNPGEPGFGTDDRAYLKTMEEISVFMEGLGFEVNRIYVSNNPQPKYYIDGTPIPPKVLNSIVDNATATDEIIKAVNQGQMIIAHRDHGEVDGWYNPPFHVNDLAKVNTRMLSIFFSINCLTGCFDNTPQQSFAEHLLKNSGAAPTLVAASRVSHTWLNDSLMKALFDAMFGGMINTFPGTTTSYPVRNCRIGDMLNYAKTYLPVSASGDPEYIKDHAEIYHVIGDPALEIWKSAPLSVQLKLNMFRSYVDISLSSCPVGSVITLWSNGKLLRTLTPASTHIHIPLIGIMPIKEFMSSTPNLTVCFTAPGYKYLEMQASRKQVVTAGETLV